jgi:hypothetical protein
MTELQPVFRDQRKVDADHLTLLSVFHYVGAGLALLGILFLMVHYMFFHAFMDNPRMWQNQRSGPPPAEFFAIFKLFYLVVGAWFVASAILNVMSAVWLGARKHRTFSLVVAGINCVHVPLGTALGIFTLVVLLRDSVRELYEAGRG